MKTKMQQEFKEQYIKPIIVILFPEFADCLNEFYISFYIQYTWICIKATKPALKIGIDNRTKKEKKQGIKDPRELIEDAISLDFAIDNHWQNEHKISGQTSREWVHKNMYQVGFRMWNFVYSYGYKTDFKIEQQNKVVEYLESVGIHKPTEEEFWQQYWKD